MRIAVLLDKEERLADVFNATGLAIYEKEAEWKVVGNYRRELVAAECMVNPRKEVLELAERMRGCQVLLGSAIVGLPYYLLAKEGYELCEAKTVSIEVLDQIKADLEAEARGKTAVKKESVTSPVAKEPVAIDAEGNYVLDMIGTQKQYPALSSKKILLPFLSHTLFQRLTIYCSHVMPWLDAYLESRGLVMEVRKEEGRYRVDIYHPTCKAK